MSQPLPLWINRLAVGALVEVHLGSLLLWHQKLVVVGRLNVLVFERHEPAFESRELGVAEQLADARLEAGGYWPSSSLGWSFKVSGLVMQVFLPTCDFKSFDRFFLETIFWYEKHIISKSAQKRILDFESRKHFETEICKTKANQELRDPHFLRDFQSG